MAKVAVVGAGYWGPNLIRNFREHKAVKELWVCDRDPVRLGRARERFHGVKTTEDYDEVLRSDADAVVLATPVGTHFQLASKALLAGKHVFVEKPLTSSLDDAKRLCELADKQKRVLMVGHTFEYSPPVV